MNEIEKIASKHLGKAGDGSIVNPYVTPDEIDATLLVAIPRILNRTAYDIDERDLPFIGADVWNCYEVSAMTDNGYPVSGVLKIAYPACSKSIVESKSLKLYLNSFNLCRMKSTVLATRQEIQRIVLNDLTTLLNAVVSVHMHTPDSASNPNPNTLKYAKTIERHVDICNINFDALHESPDLLKVVKLDSGKEFMWTTNALRSNCRVTNQPDWGDVYVYIKGESTITPESLLQYIVSMRKENHFHEEIVECIIKRLIDLLPECDIGVCALYTRRGGIDINPIRVTSYDALTKFAHIGDVTIKHKKTDRQ